MAYRSRWFKKFRVEKISIWVVFLTIVYVLRDFFDILFMTFILSYISSNIVEWIQRRIIRRNLEDWGRKLLVWGFYLIFVSLIINLAVFVIPRLFGEIQNLAKLLIPAQMVAVAKNGNNHAAKPGNEVASITTPSEAVGGKKNNEEEVKIADGADNGHQPDIKAGSKNSGPEPANPSGDEDVALTPQTNYMINIRKPLETMVHRIFKNQENERIRVFLLTPGVVERLEKYLGQSAGFIIAHIQSFVLNAWVFIFHFIISLLFSLIAVLDIPKLSQKIQRLKSSRISDFYMEITPSLIGFAHIMGRAFQAQAIIALCNTFLTGVGLIILQMPNVTLLLVVVFFCSFIPVLGVIISSVPIGVIAIQQGGFILLIQILIMIAVIHAIETYLLNPQIFGEILKIHPLLVLIILLVAEHAFGIWGLLLGLPISYYVYDSVILGVPESKAVNDAAP